MGRNEDFFRDVPEEYGALGADSDDEGAVGADGDLESGKEDYLLDVASMPLSAVVADALVILPEHKLLVLPSREEVVLVAIHLNAGGLHEPQSVDLPL